MMIGLRVGTVKKFQIIRWPWNLTCHEKQVSYKGELPRNVRRPNGLGTWPVKEIGLHAGTWESLFKDYQMINDIETQPVKK